MTNAQGKELDGIFSVYGGGFEVWVNGLYYGICSNRREAKREYDLIRVGSAGARGQQ